MTWYKERPEQLEDIEAMQVTRESIVDVAVWCGGQIVENMDGSPALLRAGHSEVQLGDYIVRLTKDVFQSWSKDRFEAKYELLYKK